MVFKKMADITCELKNKVLVNKTINNDNIFSINIIIIIFIVLEGKCDINDLIKFEIIEGKVILVLIS